MFKQILRDKTCIGWTLFGNEINEEKENDNRDGTRGELGSTWVDG